MWASAINAIYASLRQAQSRTYGCTHFQSMKESDIFVNNVITKDRPDYLSSNMLEQSIKVWDIRVMYAHIKQNNETC